MPMSMVFLIFFWGISEQANNATCDYQILLLQL